MADDNLPTIFLQTVIKDGEIENIFLFLIFGLFMHNFTCSSQSLSSQWQFVDDSFQAN